MNVIRAFIAVNLSDQVVRGLGGTLEALSMQAPKGVVRWTLPEKIHLTLKFLGDVSTASIDTITRALQAEAARHPFFDISAEGLGAFPSLRHPRVIWIGLQSPPQLESLQHGVEAEMERLGYPREERTFSPHLTLGRVRKEAQPADLRDLAEVLEGFRIGSLGTSHIEDVHLYRSELRGSGSIYTRLFTARLGETAAAAYDSSALQS